MTVRPAGGGRRGAGAGAGRRGVVADRGAGAGRVGAGADGVGAARPAGERRRPLRLAGILALSLALAGLWPAGRASAFDLHLTHLSVTPSSGLVSDQAVRVSVSGGYAGTTYAVTVCGPKVLGLLLSSAEDGCDPTQNAIVTVGPAGRAQTTLDVPAILTTATGGVDCRRGGCFLGLVALHGTGTLGLGDVLAARLSFAADACRSGCAVPADAWDPSLGPSPAPDAVSDAALAETTQTLELRPGPAGALDLPGVVTGPDLGAGLVTAGGAAGGGSAGGSAAASVGGSAAGAPATGGSPAGEGLLRLDLAAPGTSWGPGTPRSVVVDATLTDAGTGRRVGTQSFVLFYGAAPFVYAGFAGHVTTTDRYRLTIRARGRVVVRGAELEVVAPANPSYLAYAYAPVLYGRSTSALHDVPMLVYAESTPEAGGATRLAYTYVFSHEDAGSGFFPFLAYGGWGRTSDIETALSFTVGADGSVRDATYLSGGEPAKGFADSRSALREVEEPFDGDWVGHHPVLRDATGNNDFSDSGTTPFRFQLVPVAPPAPGQTREAVMDANPFTYEVMAREAARWSVTDTDPSSADLGDVGQYGLVDLDTVDSSPHAKVSSVAVSLRLSGSNRWYSSDQGRGIALVGAGHVRTAVKLPLGWASRVVTGVRVSVAPAGQAAGVHVVSLHLERFDASALRVDSLAVPTPVVR